MGRARCHGPGAAKQRWVPRPSQRRSLPNHPVKRLAVEKAEGTRAGTARHGARRRPAARQPKGRPEPLCWGWRWGGGEPREGGEFVGSSPDDNFDVLLSLENFEIGRSAAAVLSCTDSRCQTRRLPKRAFNVYLMCTLVACHHL